MVTVGTDSQYGTLYNSTTGQPYIQVGDYSVAVKSGTAQIAASAEDGGGYLTGTMIISIQLLQSYRRMTPEFYHVCDASTTV